MDNNKVLIAIIIGILAWLNWDKIKPEINIKPNIPTPSIPFPVPSIPLPQPLPQPEPQPPGVIEPQPEPQPQPQPEPPKVEPAKPIATGHWETRRVRAGLLRFTNKRVWVSNG